MIRRSRVVWTLIAIVLAITMGIVFDITPAFAGTGNQWCDSLGYCANAWNGGPFVKSEAYSTGNNDFTVIGTTYCNGGFTTSTCPGFGLPAGLPIVGIQFSGGGSWNGQCIGDAYNMDGRADSSLDSCPGSTQGAGFGTVFVQYDEGTCGQGGGSYDVFYNTHWSSKDGALRALAWTQNNNDGNGLTVYLNQPKAQCLEPLPPH